MKEILNETDFHKTDLLEIRAFKALSEEERNVLMNEASCSVYKRGTVVYREGSRLTGFYGVLGGIVKIYKTGVDGKEQIIRFSQKGDIIAYRSLLSNELACTTAKIIENALLCQIPYQTLLHLIENNSRFALNMLQIACGELKEANDYITDIAQKTVKERLAEVLLSLKKSFDLDGDNLLNISLTREELANMVGTATESVIRLLSEFKADQLIELQGRKIKFLDVARLEKVANF